METDLTPLDPATIIKRVAEIYGIESQSLLSPRRQQHVSTARTVAMWLIRRYTGLSFPKIGELFQRDHSTVISGTGIYHPAAHFKQALHPPRIKVDLSHQAATG